VARSKTLSGNGEFVHHIAAVRMRLTGTGSLQMQLNSLDDVNSVALIPFTMASPTAVEPTRLANFKSQRIQLECRTTEINEFIYKCNRIIIYAKPVEADLPSYMSP
jgi:hypothetical protein